MSILLFLCTVALIGAATARLAIRRGRDPSIWFWLGALFGLIALIVLYFLKDLRTEDIKNESKEPVLLLAEEKIIEPTGVWYILDEKHVPVGPFSFQDIRAKFQEGILTMNSYLWNEEWPDWKLASDAPEFEQRKL